MPMFYPMNVRKKILKALLSRRSKTHQEIADRFKVSMSTVKDIWKRFKETGNVEVYLNRGGRKIKISDKALNTLRQMVTRNSNLTLREMRGILASKFRIQVTTPTIYTALKSKRALYQSKNSRINPRSRKNTKKRKNF